MGAKFYGGQDELGETRQNNVVDKFTGSLGASNSNISIGCFHAATIAESCHSRNGQPPAPDRRLDAVSGAGRHRLPYQESFTIVAA
jgi:hypothetical protein